jgi:2,3-bisphosphoglycerate-dependent phosphoglycerate mutase
MPSQWPSALWLVRHGESGGNVARDLAESAGHDRITIDARRDSEVPLSKRGEEQSQALGRWLVGQPRGEQPTVILTSPYLRARSTAEIVRGELGAAGIPIIGDERLREREFGVLDRLTRRGITSQFPEQAALREALGKFYYRPPGGESWCDVILRLRSVVDSVSREHSGARILAVCHSVVVLCFRYVLERMTEEEILAIDKQADVANCSITSYELSEAGLALRRFNYVAPLRAQGAAVTTEPDVPVKPK